MIEHICLDDCASGFSTDICKPTQELLPCKQIPYTLVRTNSDYSHVPVATTGNGIWTDATPFLAPNFQLGRLYGTFLQYSAALNEL